VDGNGVVRIGMNYGHGEGCGKSTGFEDRMEIIYFTVSLSIKKANAFSALIQCTNVTTLQCITAGAE